MAQELPACKHATSEEDFFTTCFQRDSLKDEIVVIGFIMLTSGLLLWAGAKPFVQDWVGKARGAADRGSYGRVGQVAANAAGGLSDGSSISRNERNDPRLVNG